MYDAERFFLAAMALAATLAGATCGLASGPEDAAAGAPHLYAIRHSPVSGR
jgi:hypothetical protein